MHMDKYTEIDRVSGAARRLQRRGRPVVGERLEQIAIEADLASRHYVLIDARVEALLKVPTPRPKWVRAAIRRLREAASSCALDVARLLNTTPRRARHILEDYVWALEDAEQEHDPAGFAAWLLEEAALAGYLHWVDNTDEDDELEDPDDSDRAAE
jgi:hypothetical protein